MNYFTTTSEAVAFGSPKALLSGGNFPVRQLNRQSGIPAICFLCLLFPALPASADTLNGKVVKITDGDTLHVLDANYEQHKIRLAGIDAPERKQAYGLASRKHLASLVAGQQVTVEYRKRDRYGRIVGKVWADTLDVCLEQVKAGFAWHYKKYQKEQSPDDRQHYANAENQARIRRLGFWRENNPTPPWEYRHLHKSQ